MSTTYSTKNNLKVFILHITHITVICRNVISNEKGRFFVDTMAISCLVAHYKTEQL